MQQNNPSVSIVIPAYNEEKTLPKILDSLQKQRCKHDFEVIVVDNNSTDQTAKIAYKYKNTLNIKVIKEEKKGRSPARRAGFSEAKGEIILSTDADTVVPDTWIEQMVSNFVTSDIAAITGTCKIFDCSWRVNMIFNFLQPFFMHAYRMLFGHYWLSGFNFAIRKDIYVKSGGFNPNLNSQEDTDLSFRVSDLGKIKFVTSPVVICSGRRFQQGFLQGLYSYVKTYIFYFFLKNEEKTFLPDIR